MDIYNKPPLGVYLRHYCKPSLDECLAHHGIKDQKWGVRRGPPYPLSAEQKKGGETPEKPVAKSVQGGKLNQEVLKRAIESGEVSLKLNIGHQKKHLPDREDKQRSYIQGDLATAQKLVRELSGTGELLTDPKTGKWLRKERVIASESIGIYVDKDGSEISTNKLLIVYSRKGTHVYAAQSRMPRTKTDR